MKTAVVLSALASVAIAQTSSLIPTSGTSDVCKAYLVQLDGDSTLKACTTAINSATSAFSASSTSGASAVSSALNNLCTTTAANACASSTLRTVLAQLYSACQSEIDSSNADVLNIYDTLYLLGSYRTAVCTKDDSGRYCATQVPKTSDGNVAGGQSLANVQKYLGSSSGSPNATTFANSNVPFLFISSDLDATSLCVTCTKNVITSYIDWESSAAYAPGLSNSRLLPGQTGLYNAIKSKCPADFLSTSGVQAAGAVGQGIGGSLGSGAERTQVAITAAVGVVAFVAYAVSS